jgi:membrane-bound lytic murein transglycosylase MltF
MSRKQKKLAYDEAEILNVSRQIVDKALQPSALADYILDHVDECAAEDLRALRTAIDSRYPEFRERFERGERGDVTTELTIIDEMVKFHIGVAVGRRVK